jgi:hypothetical protein
LGRLLLAVAPLLLTVLFGWLTMEGHLNFGGGEKDIFLLIPLLLWSFVWFCTFLTLWWRRSPVGRSLKFSAAIATALVVSAWIILAVVVLLKSP